MTARALLLVGLATAAGAQSLTVPKVTPAPPPPGQAQLPGLPISFEGYFWADTGYMSRTNAQPGQYDQGAAYDHYLEARRASVDLLVRLVPEVKQVLTAEQLRRLPPFVASYLEPRYLASIRSGTAAFTGSAMLPGSAAMMAGGASVNVEAGPGGTRTVIISRP